MRDARTYDTDTHETNTHCPLCFRATRGSSVIYTLFRLRLLHRARHLGPGLLRGLGSGLFRAVCAAGAAGASPSGLCGGLMGRWGWEWEIWLGDGETSVVSFKGGQKEDALNSGSSSCFVCWLFLIDPPGSGSQEAKLRQVARGSLCRLSLKPSNACAGRHCNLLTAALHQASPSRKLSGTH